MSKSPVKPDRTFVYEQTARIGHAVASPARLELLDVLAQGPRTVETLARETRQTLATASHHLQVLRRARLVDGRKSGVHVTYQLADRSVGQFFLHLRSLAESRLAEMQQIAQASTDTGAPFNAVATKELVRRVRAGEVTLIDVRPREEYLAGHIPGAISLPLDDLSKRVRDLSRSRDVVAYCRGPYCVLAVEAVRLLRRKGLRAHRLALGAVEWRARGWRLEAGAVDVH